jgi:hypothetical protein
MEQGSSTFVGDFVLDKCRVKNAPSLEAYTTTTPNMKLDASRKLLHIDPLSVSRLFDEMQ